MTNGTGRVGRGKRDEAKAALVDFLRNDKQGVANGGVVSGTDTVEPQ